ncbi:MAG: M28 family peptidase, partial [Telluria sp.]
SDHFSFAKAGVPSFSIKGGKQYRTDLEGGKAKAATYAPKYHQVSDEYDASWDLSGMVQQAQFTLNLGNIIANAPALPMWKAGDAFGKVRAR